MNANILLEIADFFNSLPYNGVILYVSFLSLIVFFSVYFIKIYRSTDKFDLYKKYEKIYEVTNIVSTNDLARINPTCIVIELDTVIDETSSTPIVLYTLLNIDDKTLSYNAVHHNQHTKFLAAYRGQRWDMAITIANSLKTSYRGCLKKYYTMMIARCYFHKKNPPVSNWDGIWRYKNQ